VYGLTGTSTAAMMLMPAITAAAASNAIRIPFSPSRFSPSIGADARSKDAWATTGAVAKEIAAVARATLRSFIELAPERGLKAKCYSAPLSTDRSRRYFFVSLRITQ